MKTIQNSIVHGWEPPKGFPTLLLFEFGMSEKTIIKQVRDHYTAIHPTQKPTRLLERLLNLVCGSGALVLDCFSGSGSTAIACINTNRGFIGFEIDKEYYDLSKQRIDNAAKQRLLDHQAQLGLF